MQSTVGTEAAPILPRQGWGQGEAPRAPVCHGARDEPSWFPEPGSSLLATLLACSCHAHRS